MKKLRTLKNTKKLDGLHLGLMAVVFGVLGIVLLTLTNAAPAPPSLYLTPTTRTVAANTTFTVDVMVDSGTTPINAAGAIFTYPTTLVDFVSIDTSTSAFGIVPEATGTNGEVRISAAISAGSNPVTGPRLLGRVTFRSKTINGTGSLAFQNGSMILRADNSTNILASLASTEGTALTVDVQGPSVSITAPANSAVVPKNGSSLNVTISATDNTGVTRVDVLVNGTLATSLATAPYTHAINTNSLPIGANTLQAKAVDAYGNETTSSSVTITVTDVTAPSVSISSPSNGATVSGSIAVNASATDETGGTGVNRVEFLVNGTVAATDTTSPYSFNWSTTGLTDGSYALTARAYDNATPQNSRTSSAVSVTVDNSDRTPPSQPTNLQVSNRTRTSLTLTWGASTDNVAVTGYRITRNGTVIQTVTGLTFTDNNLTAGTSYTYAVTAIDARNNASSAAVVTTTTIKLGDVNADNKIDLVDISILLTYYGANSSVNYWQNAQVADINGDSVVNLIDLSIMLSNYGK